MRLGFLLSLGLRLGPGTFFPLPLIRARVLICVYVAHGPCKYRHHFSKAPFFLALLLDFILIYWVSFSDPYVRRWYRFGDTSVQFYVQGYSGGFFSSFFSSLFQLGGGQSFNFLSLFVSVFDEKKGFFSIS